MSSRPNDPTKTLPLTDAEAVSQKVRAQLAAQRKPFLVVLQGKDVGLRYRIQGSVVVGRDAECDLVLNDTRASKRHARFEVREGQVLVYDLGSTNGTLVNEERVEASKVRTGDKVFIGSTVMRLDWQDALEQDFHQELERLLHIDELTGLFAKRRFDAEGNVLVSSSLGRSEPVSVLMMDLDGIKKINDTHGHAFGAYTIAESGALIGRIIGDRGIATRWGGDEFSAVLPGADLPTATAIGEEILAAIRSHVYERERVRLQPGISIGVATCPEHGSTLESLQRCADEALYRAKRAGKGCVKS